MRWWWGLAGKQLVMGFAFAAVLLAGAGVCLMDPAGGATVMIAITWGAVTLRPSQWRKRSAPTDDVTCDVPHDVVGLVVSGANVPGQTRSQ